LKPQREMEALIKEAREIYDGSDLRDLNDKYVKDKAVVEKLEVVTNDSGNIRFEAEVKDITTFDQFIETMKTSVIENKHVKPIGTFAAFSEITETDGFLLKTDQYVGISKTSLNMLKEDIKTQAEKDDIVYYDVKCGITIHDVVKELKKDNRALFNLDGWGGQRIVSVNATSTHGSGVTLPPLHSFVVSVNLIAPGGMLYRIEPSKGITDPNKFHSQFPNISLIQDDKTFNASIVHIGALGVVHELTIYTISLYSVIETREETTWDHAKTILKQKPYSSNPYLQYRNCEVWLSPYTNYTLITKRNIATQEDKMKYPKPEIKKLFQEYSELTLVQEVAKILSVGVGGALFLLLNLFPATVPHTIELSMKTQHHSDPIVDTYDNIYPIGWINNFKVIAVEFSFSMKNDNHLNAIDAIVQTLKKIREEHNLNINGPASLRFSAASSQYLSMAHNTDGEPRAYLEMPILLYEPHITYYKKTYDALLQTALKFNARCHWETISLFIEQIKKFDPQGIMSNDLLNHLGLTPN
ncbi:2610_t:CDS:2, partial [Scutellospora calospora]